MGELFCIIIILVIKIATVLGLCCRDGMLWHFEEKCIPLPPVLPGSSPCPLPLISYGWATPLLWGSASTRHPLWVSHHPPAGHQPGLYSNIYRTTVQQSSVLKIHNQLSLLLKSKVKHWFRTYTVLFMSHTHADKPTFLTSLGSIRKCNI